MNDRDSAYTGPFEVLELWDSLVCVTDIDSDEILYANACFRRRFGEPHTKGRQAFADELGAIAFWKRTGGARDRSDTASYDKPSGRWYQIRIRVIEWTDGRRARVRIATDITDRKRAEQLAYYDSLTELPNRRLFEDRLRQAIAQGHRNSHGVTLLYVDLDRFKEINDSFGHTAGDQLLKAVARRLQRCLRTTDTVARLGGDEFAVILNADSAGRAMVPGTSQVAEKLLAAIAEPIVLNGRRVAVTASIGIVLYPQDARTPQELLGKADTAMYFAKAMGRNAYQFYTRRLNDGAKRQLSLERRLRHAVAAQQFTLHYQPLVHIQSGRIQAVEALLRWPTATGQLLPDGFVPLAEQSGLISTLGNWVLSQSCAQLSRWRRQGCNSLCLAVNLSPLQLQSPELAEQVGSLVSRHKLPASALQLEVSERDLADLEEPALSNLQHLKKLGVKLVLDDFGAGSGALAYLRRFPFDMVKLDRSFVAEIPQVPEANAIAEAVIRVSHQLRLSVTAEGVESESQLAFLRKHACDSVQGFVVGRPAPPDELALRPMRSTPAITGDLCSTASLPE